MDSRPKLAEYQGKLEKVIEERDFYLNKLRYIEILCTAEGAALTDKEYLVNKIMAELYETAEGFEPPEGPQVESEDKPQEGPQVESEDKPQEEPQVESQDEPQDEPQVESQDE